MVIGESLADAVNKLFVGVGSLLSGAPSQSPIGTAEVAEPTSPGSELTDPSGGLSPQALLERAQELFAEADAALGQNPPNFALYQQKINLAKEMIVEALGRISGS